MRARVAQATVRVWVEGRDDPCSLTVLVDPEGVDLSRPECFSPRAFMKSPSIYKRARVRGKSLPAAPWSCRLRLRGPAGDRHVYFFVEGNPTWLPSPGRTRRSAPTHPAWIAATRL